LKHVGKIASHPFWHAEVQDPVQRVELYRKEFLPVEEAPVPVVAFPVRRMPSTGIIEELMLMRDKISSLLETSQHA
jgi:hypothetical protein